MHSDLKPEDPFSCSYISSFKLEQHLYKVVQFLGGTRYNFKQQSYLICHDLNRQRIMVKTTTTAALPFFCIIDDYTKDGRQGDSEV